MFKMERWGKLVEAYLTLVRHVSMRPVIDRLKAIGKGRLICRVTGDDLQSMYC
jgi:hypothetical protein